MAPGHIDKALAFLQAVASRDPELAAEHVHPDEYVEHNPRVADGVGGLRAYVGRLPAGTYLEMVRVFQDGPFVVTQAQGSLLGRSEFFDVLRFENGVVAYPVDTGMTMACGGAG